MIINNNYSIRVAHGSISLSAMTKNLCGIFSEKNMYTKRENLTFRQRKKHLRN